MKPSITISGALGSGKSTVAKLLCDQLGYPYYSVGAALREIATRHSMSIQEITQAARSDPKYDHEIDSAFVSLNKSDKPYVVDARLGYHFMPSSFKVKLDTDPMVAAERVMADPDRPTETKYTSITETAASLKTRRASEVERYQKLYSLDIDDNRDFDLVVDTTNLTPVQVADQILKAYEHV